MYTNDKTNRITLRLNDKQFSFVKDNADILGVSPSEFLRMMINSALVLSTKTTEKLKENLGRENDKTDKLHQLQQ